MPEQLPVGTRIRFKRTLGAPANEEHPNIVYAYGGEFGEITGHGCKEGYWAEVYRWRDAPFGCSREEFTVESDDEN